MKNRPIRHALSYLYMPVLLTVVSAALLYLALEPVTARYYAEAKMVIAQGSPEYTNELTDSLAKIHLDAAQTKTNAAAQTSALPQAEPAAEAPSAMDIPAPGTHYANLTSLDVELTAPVYYGDSKKILSEGAGQYIGSSLPGMGKPILIGGHDSTYFKPLQGIKKGNTLTLSTNYGSFDYRVTKIMKAKASDESAYDLHADKETLILYTCYPFGRAVGDSTQRYFVFADRVKGADQEDGGQ